MSDHKGWTLNVRKARGDVLAMVWIQERQAYKTKSFPAGQEKQAKDWAMDGAASLRLKVNQPQGIGRCQVSDHQDAFLAARKSLGRSDSHMRNLGHTLTDLAAHCPDLRDQSARRRIEAWLDGLKVAPATRNRMLTETRTFTHWLMRREILDKDPTIAIDKAKEGDFLKEQFTLPELATLLATPSPHPAWQRRFALMTLAGLRDDEAAALHWDCVDLDSGVILVKKVEGHRLKRNRERIVPIMPLLRAILGDPGMPPVFPPYEGPGKQAWVTTNYNNRVDASILASTGPRSEVAPLGGTMARDALPSFLALHGIAPGKRTPHSCRHTYAGLMTATGVPSLMLAAYMGHSGMATTMGYTKQAARYGQQVKGWPRGEFQLGAA